MLRLGNPTVMFQSLNAGFIILLQLELDFGQNANLKNKEASILKWQWVLL
jgi:hypothetical protein